MSTWDFWKQLNSWVRRQVSTSKTHLPDTQANTPADDKNNIESAAAETTRKPSEPAMHPFVKPTLYFSGWGYDERNNLGHYARLGENTTILQAGGQRFVARRWSYRLIFREIEDKDERAALIVTRELDLGRAYQSITISNEEFAATLAAWQFGRVLLYVGENMNPGQCAYLCFASNGSGIAYGEYQARLAFFTWKDDKAPEWATLLTSAPEELRPFCRWLFETRINPHCSDPYIEASTLETIPHRFLQGSEAELRLLTTAIVQTEPGLFENSQEPVSITYRAQMPQKRAGMRRVEQGKRQVRSGRITSLCDLALRLNPFVGVEWKPCIANPNRLSHWDKQIHKITVMVYPPSAHERAESLLVLADWLEGKVREEKRLRLLGIEE